MNTDREQRIKFQQGLIDNAHMTTCTNCVHWKTESGCEKWEMMPPAEVIVVGCEEWCFMIPF